MSRKFVLAAALAMLASPAVAAPEDFTQGPVITGFGAVAKIDSDLKGPPGMDYRVAFDVGSGKAGERNKGIDGAARLMNMLANSGVPVSKIHPAIVLHNSGIYDVTNNARYGQQYGGAPNPNADLVRQLVAKGVPIYICGQSAAWVNVAKSDLLPGVKMALSAMDAHAILQNQGYTLNPF
jgi:intracellular sulfur oxidation DsrE/DsrF family protein